MKESVKQSSIFYSSNILTAVETKISSFINENEHYTGISTNSKNIAYGNIFIGIQGQKFDGKDYFQEAIANGAKCLILENISEEMEQELRRMSVSFINVKNSIEALKEMASYRRSNDLQSTKVIAITGSAGKTTVKNALSGLIEYAGTAVAKTKGNQNNHIGLPISILKAPVSANVLILELGTNSPGEIENLSLIARPNIAIVTNVGIAHIGGFASERDLAIEKYSILKGLQPGGIAILNREDKYIEESFKISQEYSIKNIFFVGNDNNSNVYCQNLHYGLLYSTNFEVVFQEGEQTSSYNIVVPTILTHQATLFLFVAAVAKLFRFSNDLVVSFIEHFSIGSNRGQVSRVRVQDKNVVIVNDSYNSNPESLRLGIQSVQNFNQGANRNVFVIADMLELGDLSEKFHSEICTYFNPSYPNIFVALLGEEVKHAVKGLEEKGIKYVLIENYKDLSDAMKQFLEPGDLVYCKGSNSTGLYKSVERLFHADINQNGGN